MEWQFILIAVMGVGFLACVIVPVVWTFCSYQHSCEEMERFQSEHSRNDMRLSKDYLDYHFTVNDCLARHNISSALKHFNENSLAYLLKFFSGGRSSTVVPNYTRYGTNDGDFDMRQFGIAIDELNELLVLWQSPHILGNLPFIIYLQPNCEYANEPVRKLAVKMGIEEMLDAYYNGVPAIDLAA